MAILKKYGSKPACNKIDEPKPKGLQLITPLTVYVCYFEEKLYRLISANSFMVGGDDMTIFYKVYGNDKGEIFRQSVAMFYGINELFEISSDIAEEMRKFEMGFAYKPSQSASSQQELSDEPQD